jgi:predicted acetyltransferase
MIEIRATAAEDYRAASAVVSTALMHAPANDEDWAKSLPSWEDSDSLSAWDGDRCVGHAGGYRFVTIVPGGQRVATCGVTRVGVLPTHRRQGVARRLLEQVLVDAHERGQVLASLRASDARIYPRFGFGLAGTAVEAIIRPGRAHPVAGAAAGSLRLLAHHEVLDVVIPLYDRIASRPGAIVRPAWMWKRYFSNATELGGDAEFVAVHTDTAGNDDGFVHYAVKWKEERGELPQGTGEVYDLWGADDAVELALWEYVCGVDLVTEWYAEERPVDDPAQLGFADWRAYQAKTRWDEQWLRLLDVDVALAARTYNETASAVTIAVRDELLPSNDGVWEVSGSGAKRTSTAPEGADLAVTARDLAATYLGGTPWSALAGAGRVDVRDHGALRVADALFVSARAPFCCSGF